MPDINRVAELLLHVSSALTGRSFQLRLLLCNRVSCGCQDSSIPLKSLDPQVFYAIRSTGNGGRILSFLDRIRIER